MGVGVVAAAAFIRFRAVSQQMIVAQGWRSLELSVFVVNLPRSAQRRARMRARLEAVGARFEFVEAIDGRDAPAVRCAFLCEANASPRVYSRRANDVSDAEIACTLSHMRAVRAAYRAGASVALICEDDVEFDDLGVAELSALLEALPADAACLQLCVTPAQTVAQLADYRLETGAWFVMKRKAQPTRFDAAALEHVSCHCAAAYVVTRSGMTALSEGWFRDEAAILPCSEAELRSNAGLLADRFVYRALVGERTNAYVCCTPTFVIEAEESLLHPDHLDGHALARKTMLAKRAELRASGGLADQRGLHGARGPRAIDHSASLQESSHHPDARGVDE